LKFLVLLRRHVACWKTSFLCLETFLSQLVEFLFFWRGWAGGLGFDILVCSDFEHFFQPGVFLKDRRSYLSIEIGCIALLLSYIHFKAWFWLLVRCLDHSVVLLWMFSHPYPQHELFSF
jgi:hypothetical protein